MQTKTAALETEGATERWRDLNLRYTQMYFFRKEKKKNQVFPMSNYPLDGISNEGKRSQIA